MKNTIVEGAGRTIFLLGLLTLGASWHVIGHYAPWITFHQDAVAALGCALIALAAVALNDKMHWARLCVVALLLALVPIAQRAMGLVPFNSSAFLPSAYLVWFALMIATGLTLSSSADSEHRTAAVMGVLAGGAVAGVTLALMQWQSVGVPNLWVTAMRGGGRPYANFAQPNHLATLIGMGCGGFLYLFETRRIGAIAASFSILFLQLGLVMTQSRSGWLFVLVTAFTGLILQRRGTLRVQPAAIFVFVAIFAALVTSWEQINAWMLLSPSAALEDRLKFGTRQIMWPMLFAASLRHPWFGYGWGQVGQAQHDFAANYPATQEFYLSAHNQILDLALMAGWPTALVVTAALVVWYSHRVMRCTNGRTWSVLLAVTAIWVHAMVEWPLWFAYFLFPLGLLMGMAQGLTPTRAWVATRWTLLVPVLALGGLGVAITAEYFPLESATRMQRFAAARLEDIESVKRPNVRLLDAEMAHFDFATDEARKGMTAQELARMKAVVELNAFPGAVFRYASALALNGQPAEAAATLVWLCKMNHPAQCARSNTAWRQLAVESPEYAAVPLPREDY